MMATIASARPTGELWTMIEGKLREYIVLKTVISIVTGVAVWLVLAVFQVPLALMLGLLFPVDRIMDMARTAVNVTGDAAVATTVAKWEGELDEETFRTPAVV